MKLVIYLIGYSKEGEAVLILVKADNVTRYSIVIDGYKVEEQNVVCDLLKSEGLTNISMFCWLHPDRDHSVGIEDYIPFINRDTRIVVGDGFSETKEKWEKGNETMYRFIEEEFNKMLSRKDRVEIRKVCKGMNLKKIKFTDVRTGIEYPFEVHTFAPSDYLNLRREMKGMNLINNDISLGLDIKVGSMSAVFCADVSNVIFHSITNEDFPELVDYIKIPHHASSSSDKVLNVFSNKAEVACTTVNTANKLPDNNIIDKYKRKAKRIFCTNDLLKEEQSTTYGVVKTTFHIDQRKEITNDLYGNAKEVV